MNNFESSTQMQARTKRFAVAIIIFFSRLPKRDEARVIGRQLLRSGTSVAANYRAACRAKSNADFVSKMGTVVEEIDETAFWLELLLESGVCTATETENLKSEGNELLRILSSALATAKHVARRPTPNS